MHAHARKVATQAQLQSLAGGRVDATATATGSLNAPGQIIVGRGPGSATQRALDKSVTVLPL